MRPLVIVHADACTISIAWIVLEPVQLVPLTVLFVRTIQRYLRLITSGNGTTKLRKSVTRALLSTSTLEDLNTTATFQRLRLHYQNQ